MKMTLLIISFIIKVHAQTLYVAPEVDLKSISSVYKEKLFSQQILKKEEARGVRDEIMNQCHMYLQNTLSANEFEKSLWVWSQAGWSAEERWVLVDTLKKASAKLENRQLWICRLSAEEKCATETIMTYKLPRELQDFEGLILDGKPYERVNWDGAKISSSFYNWTFVSSKYKNFQFKGTWQELQKQKPQLEAYVLGSCKHPQAHTDIQSLSADLYYGEKCIRPSILPIVEEKNFYEKNKKAIWWTLGIMAGVGLAKSLQGKSIVFDKPGFM